MIALETLQSSMFTGLVGHEFKVHAGSGAALRLADVKVLGHKRPDAFRDPFSLTFSGAPSLRIPQGTYHLECEAFGTMEIFIAQTGDGSKGSEFEAIFT